MQTQLDEARRLTIESSTRETELTARIADLQSREKDLNARIAELERLADQVMANASAADRAKRALAVAVALLDQIAPEGDKTS